MKKNNKLNKLIVLSIIALILTVSVVIFVLNYTKDSSSLSLLEKGWINNHASNVIDVSIYNDVPIYGQDGEGITFSFLEEFTRTYNIEFNRVPYLTSGTNNLKNVAFRILNFEDALNANDILIYEDHYVIVGLKQDTINDISLLDNVTLGVLDRDMSNVKYYLNDNDKITYVSLSSIDDMFNMLKGDKVKYIAIPENLYLDDILANDLSIVYHISELYKKYVLTVNNDNTLKSIFSKFNLIYQDNYVKSKEKEYFLNTFFKYKKLSEAERMSYNGGTYVYGYVVNMPYENNVNKEFVGILSNYLSGFEDLTNVEFKTVMYKSIDELKLAYSHGDVDLLFANFDLNGVNVDTLYTNSLFDAEYLVLSQKPISVNSIRSLKGLEVSVVRGTYLYNYLNANSILNKSYANTDELLRNINSESIVIVDRDTYEYYKDSKFRKFKIIYQNTIKDNYKFAIRDVNKNKTFYELYNYYVSSIDYKDYRYSYNTDYVVSSRVGFTDMIKYIFIVLGITALVITAIMVIIKIRTNKKKLNKEDKLKFIDVMTSLKNRNYLNYNIKSWEENVIYPQTIIIIDLNNIKYINDNYGHEEGDEVIKRAASTLLASQLENTDIVRTDGNEFLIYMVGYDEKDVIEYTRRLSKELKELPHEFGATLGYSMILDDVKTIDDAINEATLSMRQAKEKL